MTNLISPVDLGFVDKRRNAVGGDNDSNLSGAVIFTANAAGTTGSMVGTNATLSNGSNVVRVGEKFKIVNASNVAKEETVFQVTNVQIDTPGAGSTTVNFFPAAAAATTGADRMRILSHNNYKDEDSLDGRLSSLDSGAYSTARLASMTTNDKVFALRQLHEPGGL